MPPAPAQVLEVGCGDGVVAAGLAARGYRVTALDESLALGGDARAVAGVRWVESNFLFHDEPDGSYDVVLFTRSLHHMPVERALDRAAALLAAGGHLVAEEFAVDRVNIPTARWWYDTEALLAAAGVITPPDAALSAVRNPLGRWRQEHAHEPPLASGHDMLAAVRERFMSGPAEEAPYLYRYVHARALGAQADRVVREVFEIESRLLRERDIAAAGLRVTATRPA